MDKRFIKVDHQVTSYANRYFIEYREAKGITDYDVMESFDPQKNNKQIFKTNSKFSGGDQGNDGGSSSSFFFFTYDERFIVKTCPKNDFKTFMSLIP